MRTLGATREYDDLEPSGMLSEIPGLTFWDALPTMEEDPETGEERRVHQRLETAPQGPRHSDAIRVLPQELERDRLTSEFLRPARHCEEGRRHFRSVAIESEKRIASDRESCRAPNWCHDRDLLCVRPGCPRFRVHRRHKGDASTAPLEYMEANQPALNLPGSDLPGQSVKP